MKDRDEGQVGLGEDGRRDLLCCRDDDDTDDVRDDVFLNDPSGRSADGLRGEDVLILFDGQDLPSYQAGHADPVQKAEDNEHGDHVRAEVREQRDL